MAFGAQVVRVLIASPSDVHAERDAAEEVIHAWNVDHARATGTVLLPVRWETAATAESGDRAQAIVNRQIVDEADVLVGIFWTRMGTATGVAASGTAEEIGRFDQAGKPISLFFSSKPVVPDSLDMDQWESLKTFRTDQEARGLVPRFSDTAEFTRQLASALTRIVREQFGVTDAAMAAPTAPKAHVTASMVNLGGTRSVMITNDGAGEAQTVTLRTEAPEGQQAWRLLNADEPIDYLAAGQVIQIRAALHLGSSPRVNCFVSWRNEDGTEGNSRNTLQL